MTGPPQPPKPPAAGPGSIARTVTLGVVGFVATLILLFGLTSLIRPAGGGAGPSGSAGGAATPSNRATLVPASATATGAIASPAGASPSGSGGASPSGSVGASPSGPAASPSGDPVLVGAGDIADCDLGTDSATAALLETIPGTVFTAGDNVYPDGTATQFRDCYGPTWGQFLDRTRPAAGNHDWVTKNLGGYAGYFGQRAEPNGTSWYSYDLGTWHVVVLDSDCTFVGGCDAGSVQGRWLAADLQASTARCTLAIWHTPRFSSGEHGNDPNVAPFWRSLYDAGADVVINGHDHDYERFAPQDPDAREDRARGIREFVVGTGGEGLRTFPKTVANSELRSALTFGVLRLTLHPASYDWEFVPVGDFHDSGAGPCH